MIGRGSNPAKNSKKEVRSGVSDFEVHWGKMNDRAHWPAYSLSEGG